MPEAPLSLVYSNETRIAKGGLLAYQGKQYSPWEFGILLYFIAVKPFYHPSSLNEIFKKFLNHEPN